MSGRYSYLIQFEHKNGEPDKEIYYDDMDEAEEFFRGLDDPLNEDLKNVSCISLIEVDWECRANRNLDAIVFE